MPLPSVTCPNCGVPYSVPKSATRLQEDARHLTFAKMSAELLLANIPTLPPRVLVAEYAAALDGMGLKPKSSSMRGPISDRVREHWGDAVLSELGLLGKKPFAMPRNILYSVEATTHPVFHLLLIGVLFGSIKAFATQLEFTRSRSRGQTRGDDVVALLESHQRDVFAASAFSHVPVWSLARAALTQNVIVGRYFGKRDPRLTGLIECGLAEGAQINEIAAIAAVSVETVYRRLKENAETAAKRALRLREVDLQERRETFLKWYRGPHRSTQGNSKYTYRALYHWLYYNDRVWLERAVGRANG